MNLSRLILCSVLVLGACAEPAAPPANPVAAVETAASCHLPGRISPARERPPPADEIIGDAPTSSYMLALTWAPEACRAGEGGANQAMQCQDNDFGFVLHGLWPNGPRGRNPRYCGPAPALSAATVRRHLCMTPSPASLQHEWAAHGTCGWTSPEAYFADAAKLWKTVRLPPMPATLTAGQIRDAFVRANPGVRRDGVYIKTVDDNRLMDVRLCYDLKYRPSACRGGLGAPDSTVVRITPRRPR